MSEEVSKWQSNIDSHVLHSICVNILWKQENRGMHLEEVVNCWRQFLHFWEAEGLVYVLVRTRQRTHQRPGLHWHTAAAPVPGGWHRRWGCSWSRPYQRGAGASAQPVSGPLCRNHSFVPSVPRSTTPGQRWSEGGQTNTSCYDTWPPFYSDVYSAMNVMSFSFLGLRLPQTQKKKKNTSLTSMASLSKMRSCRKSSSLIFLSWKSSSIWACASSNCCRTLSMWLMELLWGVLLLEMAESLKQKLGKMPSKLSSSENYLQWSYHYEECWCSKG